VAAQESALAKVAPKYRPLMSNGIQLAPTGNTHFAKDEHLMVYLEIYEPLASAEKAQPVGAHLRITNPVSGVTVQDLGVIDAACCRIASSVVVPMALEVGISKLPPGPYRLEAQAVDALGESTQWRVAEFTVE
jgi:hypothetical protein